MMSTNFAKRLKKYRYVLCLPIVLFLTNCAPTNKALKTKVRQTGNREEVFHADKKVVSDSISDAYRLETKGVDTVGSTNREYRENEIFTAYIREYDSVGNLKKETVFGRNTTTDERQVQNQKKQELATVETSVNVNKTVDETVLENRHVQEKKQTDIATEEVQKRGYSLIEQIAVCLGALLLVFLILFLLIKKVKPIFKH